MSRKSIQNTNVSGSDLLLLQKLMYQSHSAVQAYQTLAQKAEEARARATTMNQRFMDEVSEVKKRYGLEEWQDIDLSDETGGAIIENKKKRQELEQQRDANGKSKKVTEEKALA